MEPSDLLLHIAEVLERLGVRYLVTGSIATIYYGEPRYTNDIDIVADLPLATVPEFCRAFPSAKFYLDEESVRQAISGRGQFNIIHPQSGLKIDVMIPTDSAFNRSRFARTVRVALQPGHTGVFASAEDVIIKKLEYYRAGGSEKHLRDITGVLKISGDRIDRAYILDWASRLGLEAVWQAVRDRVQKG